MNLTPLNTIALILFCGLEIRLLGTDIEKPAVKLIGNIIMLVGWVLQIISLMGKAGV